MFFTDFVGGKKIVIFSNFLKKNVNLTFVQIHK